MMEKSIEYFIELKTDGSFPNQADNIFTVNPSDRITILLDSKKLINYTPLLLSNFPQTSKKDITQPRFPDCP